MYETLESNYAKERCHWIDFNQDWYDNTQSCYSNSPWRSYRIKLFVCVWLLCSNTCFLENSGLLSKQRRKNARRKQFKKERKGRQIDRNLTPTYLLVFVFHYGTIFLQNNTQRKVFFTSIWKSLSRLSQLWRRYRMGINDYRHVWLTHHDISLFTNFHLGIQRSINFIVQTNVNESN